jgi:nucleoside-diphosphate-sugar epimerase
MNVFVAGATGVLGHRLVAQLAADGHTVYGLVRDEAGAGTVESAGGIPCRGDVLEREALSEAVADREIDTVVHAATAIPSPEDQSSDAWERNDRVRLDGAKNLLSVIGDDIEQFVFPSVVWLARQPDGSAFDECSPRHPTVATESAAAVEDLLQSAGGERGFDVSVLRLGFLYAHDAAHTRYFGRELLSRDLPVIGGGLLGRRDAEFSMLHAEDAARALATVVDAGSDGLWHVVDEEPVAVATLLERMAGMLEAPSPRRVPGWLVRILADEQTVRFMTSPMPTSNVKFTREFDWEPKYPTYREGLEQVLQRWRDDGTLRETDRGYEWESESDSAEDTDPATSSRAV